MKIKQERDELEKLLEGSSEKIGKEIDASTAPELQMGPAFEVNYDELQKDCEKKAKKMIHNATGLMFSDELVKDNPYLKNKMQVDVISLAGMLYQLNINEMMQKALMEEVRSGAMHPRMFEVFGQMSKTIGELNKQLLQTVEAIKSTYRDLKQDIREKNQDMAAIGQGSITKTNDGIIALGTKELIKETKKLKMSKDLDIQDVDAI